MILKAKFEASRPHEHEILRQKKEALNIVSSKSKSYYFLNLF